MLVLSMRDSPLHIHSVGLQTFTRLLVGFFRKDLPFHLMKRMHLPYLVDNGKLIFLVSIIILSCSAKNGKLETKGSPLSGFHYGTSDQIRPSRQNDVSG